MTPALRTMEDFIRQRMTVDRRRGLSVSRLPDGRWQAQTDNPDGSFTVMIADDPANALWNALVPYTMHRRVASGRVMAPEGAPAPAAAGPDDDLDVLLGIVSASPPSADDSLAELLA